MNWREEERAYDDEVIGDEPLVALFEASADRHVNRPAQCYKGGVYDRSLTDTVLEAAQPGTFRTISYGEMRHVVRRLAAGFRDLGVEAGDRVAIASHTRMEWAQTDFALLATGAVVTTVYPTVTTDLAGYLLSNSAAQIVVAESQALVDRIVAVDEDPSVDWSAEYIVSMDTLDDYEDRESIVTLGDVYDRGASVFDLEDYEMMVTEADLEDLASLIYTSGTTGRPKGVPLTHGNFRANINQCRKRFRPRPGEAVPGIDHETTAVSYLPLSHVLERTAGHFLMFASGACVAYAESPDTLKEDFAAVGPTVATSVPRVYEKMYDAIREQATESSVKKRIFEWSTDVGVAYETADSPGPFLSLKRAVADRLVFSTVRDALGGNIEMMISGGGSLSKELCTLYHGMGLPIFEGYGLTETSPVVTVNPPDAPKIGTIGPPLVDLEIDIDESVVDAETFDDPGAVGELLVSGPNVVDGYWNNEAATRRSFTEGGWFRTGDIVHRRPDGYIEFRERAKQLIVLSTGKNVAPAPIEDAFAASTVVDQAMVVGEGEKFVGAILVPNVDYFDEWANEQGFSLPEDPADLCADERVRERVEREVDRVNENFERHERITDFRLVPQEFTEENDMLTPTMKKKRRVIIDRFEDEVTDLYAE